MNVRGLPWVCRADAWNKFDGIVVTVSWLGIIIGFKAQVARAFRAFRIVLVLKSATGLQVAPKSTSASQSWPAAARQSEIVPVL